MVGAEWASGEVGGNQGSEPCQSPPSGTTALVLLLQGWAASVLTEAQDPKPQLSVRRSLDQRWT